jgi:hypothetical protein
MTFSQELQEVSMDLSEALGVTFFGDFWRYVGLLGLSYWSFLPVCHSSSGIDDI